MIAYSRPGILISFLILLILSYFIVFKTDWKYKKFYLCCLIIIFSLVYGLRDFRIGVDTKEYLSRYNLMSGNKDPLFALLTNALHYFLQGNKQLYLLSIAFLTNVTLGAAIYRLLDKNIERTILAYLLTVMLPYVILSNVNIIRQGLSVSFILLSLSYIDKKKISFFIFAIISIGLHKMMVIFWLIFLTIYFFKIKPKYLFYLSLIVCIVLKFPFVIDILENFKWNFYIEKLLLHISPISINNIIKIIFYYLNFCLLIWIGRKNDKGNNILQSLYLTMLLASAIFSFSELYSMRFLIALEFILPMYYLIVLPLDFKIKKIKLNSYVILSSLCYAYLFISLFLNALTTDLRL